MLPSFNASKRPNNKNSNPFSFYIFDDLFGLNKRYVEEDYEMNANVVEEIISSLDPHLIPWIYIDLAFVTGLDGRQREVTGDELLSLLNHPALETAGLSVEVIMDRQKLRLDITKAIDDFWSCALHDGNDIESKN